MLGRNCFNCCQKVQRKKEKSTVPICSAKFRPRKASEAGYLGPCTGSSKVSTFRVRTKRKVKATFRDTLRKIPKNFCLCPRVQQSLDLLLVTPPPPPQGIGGGLIRPWSGLVLQGHTGPARERLPRGALSRPTAE